MLHVWSALLDLQVIVASGVRYTSIVQPINHKANLCTRKFYVARKMFGATVKICLFILICSVLITIRFTTVTLS